MNRSRRGHGVRSERSPPHGDHRTSVHPGAGAITAGAIYDGGESATIEVFGLSADTTIGGVFIAGLATMLIFFLGVWMLFSSMGRSRRKRMERKQARNRQKESVSQIEEERAQLRAENERLNEQLATGRGTTAAGTTAGAAGGAAAGTTTADRTLDRHRRCRRRRMARPAAPPRPTVLSTSRATGRRPHDRPHRDDETASSDLRATPGP